MKNRKLTIVLVLLGLACLPTAIPFATFVWEAISFGVKLSIREREARDMTPEVARQIIEDAKQFAVLHTKEKEYFDFRTSALQQISLPESIKKLEPRRISGQKDSVMISLLFMMDTGGELYVSKDKDGIWILEGNFGERDRSFRIYPK